MKSITKSDLLIFVTSALLSVNCVEKDNSVSDKDDVHDQEAIENEQNDHSTQEENQITGVIFSENFESSSVSELYPNWDDRKNTKGMSFSDDIPKGSTGKQSLMMTYIAGENEGGHLFKLLPGNFDSLFARFYVKFLTRKSKIHHFVKLGGYNPAVSYPQGFAGMKPKGDDFLISGIECPLSNSWEWGFYTYWKDMVGKPPNSYWGNTFRPETPLEMKVGEWTCVEFMLKMNSPVEESNGEMAFWINGEKTLHLKENSPKMQGNGNRVENSDGSPFEGFQWRNDKKLALNFFWLNYYMTKGNPGEIDQVLFDEVVISTEYIGTL